jgi:hypothetical protein
MKHIYRFKKDGSEYLVTTSEELTGYIDKIEVSNEDAKDIEQAEVFPNEEIYPELFVTNDFMLEENYGNI